MNLLKRWLPILEWLPLYQGINLRGDVVAGVTVAMMLIPQAMSYAMLAGLPAIHGLYAGILPVLVYAILGTSRQLAVGPAAMVALLVSSGIGSLGAMAPETYVMLAIVLAGMIGLIQLLMGVLKLGYLTNFMSHPVISGFTSAAAIIIIVSQMGHVLGLSLPRSENIFELLTILSSRLGDANSATVVIGVSAFIAALAFKRWAPRLPNSMLLLVGSTFVVWFFRLDLQGVSVVGNIPKGLPVLAVPIVTWQQIEQLLPTAMAIAFIGFIESIAVARKLARENRYDIIPNQELVGLGMANIVGSLFQAMPAAGGFGRSAVNNAAGANTQLASIITAVFLGLSLVFLTPMFFYIPKAALGVIIIVAVFGLVDTSEVRHLWRVKREDLALLVFTFVATLTIGVKEGILVGIIASLVWFLAKTTRPHFAVMGQIPDTEDYRNVKRYNVLLDPRVLILRFDAQFYYGNVSFLKEKIREQQASMGPELRCIVIDACSINQLDSSADTALHELVSEGRERGLAYFFAYVKGPVMDVMTLSGFVERVGKDRFFHRVHTAVQAAKQWSDASRTNGVKHEG